MGMVRGGVVVLAVLFDYPRSKEQESTASLLRVHRPKTSREISKTIERRPLERMTKNHLFSYLKRKQIAGN